MTNENIGYDTEKIKEIETTVDNMIETEKQRLSKMDDMSLQDLEALSAKLKQARTVVGDWKKLKKSMTPNQFKKMSKNFAKSCGRGFKKIGGKIKNRSNKK